MKASRDATKGKECQETREENLKLSIRKSYYGTTITRSGRCRRSNPPPSCIYIPEKNGKLSMPRLPWGQSGAVIAQEVPQGLYRYFSGRPPH